jgi:hypothetical protein
MNAKSELEYIKSNIRHLPLKDQQFAKKYLDNRDFSSLQELVDSALYKITKNLNSDNPKEEYKILDVDSIEELSVKIDEYCMKVYGESQRLNAADLYDEEEEYYESFNDYDLNDIY